MKWEVKCRICKNTFISKSTKVKDLTCKDCLQPKVYNKRKNYTYSDNQKAFW